MNILISSRNLGALPSISKLKQTSQSIAMLDAILEPEWEFRYYSYNSKWGKNEEMGSMRDGGGNSYFILFNRRGAIIKGFNLESPMGEYASENGHPWKGILDDVPNTFDDFLSEPAFSISETSFCMWQKVSDKTWEIGDIKFPEENDPDGSEDLLNILDGNPNTYLKWAEEYYEKTLNGKFVEAIYNHRSISNEIVFGLNPKLNIDDLKDDIFEINYPI